MLTGALNTNGLPLAEAALGATMLATTFGGYLTGSVAGGELVNASEARQSLKNAWS